MTWAMTKVPIMFSRFSVTYEPQRNAEDMTSVSSFFKKKYTIEQR